MIKKITALVMFLTLVSSVSAGQTNAQQKSQGVTTEKKSMGSPVLKDLLVILIINSHNELSKEINLFENQTIHIGILDDISDLDFKEYICQLKTEHNVYRLGVTPKYSGAGLKFGFTRPKGDMGISKAILVFSDIHLKEREQLQLTANDAPEPFSLFTYLVNNGKKEFVDIKKDQSELLYISGRKLYEMNCKKTKK